MVTLAVSIDHKFTQRAFADRDGYTFPLLADFWPHGAIAQEYGVFAEDKGAALRGTFIIDKAGVVRWSVSTRWARPATPTSTRRSSPPSDPPAEPTVEYASPARGSAAASLARRGARRPRPVASGAPGA